MAGPPCDPAINTDWSVVVAEDRPQPLGSGARGLDAGRDGVGAVVEGGELLAEVALETRAVLALEGTQRLDLAVELVALLLEVAEELLAALGGLRVEHLRPLAGVRLGAVGLHL